MIELQELQTHCLIRVVDDDPGVRDSYRFLLEGEGWMTRTYDSAESFLAKDNASIPGCIILDLRMDGLTGADLHRLLIQANSTLSVIFVSAHGTIADAVKAVKRGALDFLTKPVDDLILINTVKEAATKSYHTKETNSSRIKFDSLTDREKEVAILVAKGSLNKQIAANLDISERTVQVHRANALKKLGVRTSAELVKLMVELNLI